MVDPIKMQLEFDVNENSITRPPPNKQERARETELPYPAHLFGLPLVVGGVHLSPSLSTDTKINIRLDHIPKV